VFSEIFLPRIINHANMSSNSLSSAFVSFTDNDYSLLNHWFDTAEHNLNITLEIGAIFAPFA